MRYLLNEVLGYSKSYVVRFLRTKDNLEIDLIIGRPGLGSVQIEIKSKNKVTEADAKSLETLGKDLGINAERLLLSNDKTEQKFGSTRALRLMKGIAEVFGLPLK